MFSKIPSSVTLMDLNLDIRLIYLTQGYLLYQEIKAYVTIFTHTTEAVCGKPLSTKSQHEESLCITIPAIWSWLAAPCTDGRELSDNQSKGLLATLQRKR